MKKLLSIIALAAIFQSAYASTLNGKIKGLRSCEAKLYYYHPITMEETAWSTEVKRGKFSLQFEIAEPKMATLMIGKEVTSVYIAPNQDLHVNLDAAEFDETLEYSGDFAAANNFLKEYFLAFEDEGKDSTRGWYASLGSEDFLKKHQERLQAKLNLLEEHREKGGLSEHFYNLFKQNETYSAYGAFLYFPMIKAAYKKVSRAEVVHEGYFAFLEECSFEDNELLKSSDYHFFLSQYLNYKMSDLLRHSNGGYEAINQFLLAKMLLKGEIRTAAQAGYLKSYLRKIDLSKLSPYWDEFIAECDEEVSKYLQAIYDKSISLQEGNAAPQFTLLNLDGEEVSLSDFKGKVVYLDFWASWCGPCLQQVPYAKELQKEYADEEDLVFLYLSIDRDENDWRKAVKEKELRGVHILAKDFSHKVPQSYNVGGIPTYFIIGKDGNIYKKDAPRPSSGDELIELLNSALEE